MPFGTSPGFRPPRAAGSVRSTLGRPGSPPWLPGIPTLRLVPDTSWNAAANGGVDVWITAHPQAKRGNTTGCWQPVAGTSEATPQTAALIALANAARASERTAPLGFLDPILYSGLGASSAYNDVTPIHEGSAGRLRRNGRDSGGGHGQQVSRGPGG
jgi:subtilase family serine protease